MVKPVELCNDSREDFVVAPESVLDSPITKLCNDCRECQWCIPKKQCLIARLKKSEEFYRKQDNGKNR